MTKPAGFFHRPTASGPWRTCAPPDAAAGTPENPRLFRGCLEGKKGTDDFFHGQLDSIRKPPGAIPAQPVSHPREKIHFVTGRLAAPSLEEALARLAPEAGFEPSVQVMNITVAALMTTPWIARRIAVPAGTERVIVPGLASGSLDPIREACGVPVERGPEDLRRLDEHFGRRARDLEGYGAHSIEILAEINHAPRLAPDAILAEARRMRADGADRIDLGCDPGGGWSAVGEVVRRLVDDGHPVSIDSFDPDEVAAAVAAGASLVLSVNSSNAARAADWGVEVVAIPDVPSTLEGLDATLATLDRAGVRYRIDPVLEPIGFGLAASLGRYIDTRRRFPAAPMMMGIGNLTELTDVDSAGVNVLLLGICAELGIGSVLTTEVIHWARSSVRECDLARRLVHHAVTRRTLPKHVEPRLITLRSGRPQAAHGDEALDRLAAAIRDTSYRMFAERGRVHLVGRGLHLADADPFALFSALEAERGDSLDPSHAFYLGYEAAKAVTALTLDKDYRQDQALDWGHLTRPEIGHGPSRAAARAAGEGGPAPAEEGP